MRETPMYAILKGEVSVHEHKHHFGTLSIGDCFGEYALIDNKARSASVTAAAETQVAKIERQHFLDLMEKRQGFCAGHTIRND